jgi:hypothetical protein
MALIVVSVSLTLNLLHLLLLLEMMKKIKTMKKGVKSMSRDLLKTLQLLFCA